MNDPWKPLTEVEAAFARAKLQLVKAEIRTAAPGVVYEPEFNHYYHVHPQWCSASDRCAAWGIHIKKILPKRHGRRAG